MGFHYVDDENDPLGDDDLDLTHRCPSCRQLCDCGMGYMNITDCEHCSGPESEV